MPAGSISPWTSGQCLQEPAGGACRKHQPMDQGSARAPPKGDTTFFSFFSLSFLCFLFSSVSFLLLLFSFSSFSFPFLSFFLLFFGALFYSRAASEAALPVHGGPWERRQAHGHAKLTQKAPGGRPRGKQKAPPRGRTVKKMNQKICNKIHENEEKVASSKSERISMRRSQKSWKKKEQWNGVDARSIHGAPVFSRISPKNKKNQENH